MSGAACKEQKLEGVWCHSLRDPSIVTLLDDYQSLLQGLLGPSAGTLLLQHKAGLDTFLNSSSHLLKRINPHHPCLKFVNCLMEAQNSSYSCLGLYVGILCCSLLRELLTLVGQEDLPTRVVKDAADAIMHDILTYMENKPNNIVTSLDISKLDHMMAFVSTSLCSKNLGLTSAEKNHLKMKIVEAFLETVPTGDSDETFGHVHITLVEGRSAVEAKVVRGVFYRELEPNLKLINYLMRTISSAAESETCKEGSSLQGTSTKDFMANNSNASTISGQTLKNTIHSKLSTIAKYTHNPLLQETASIHQSSKGNDEFIRKKELLRVILFNVPLAYEKTGTESVTVTVGSNEDCYNSITNEKLKHIIKRADIDVIACQKVVSPVVKFECEKEGILVLERLGTQLTDYLQKLTGCTTLSDVNDVLMCCSCPQQQDNVHENNSDTKCCSCYDVFVGQLTSIDVVELNNKTYLQLDNQQLLNMNDISDDVNPRTCGTHFYQKQNKVVTLLLPAISIIMAENLKVLVEETLQCLRGVTLQPLLSAAGGCTESALACSVAHQTYDTMQQRAAELDVSLSHYKLVSSAITRVFAKLSMKFSGGQNSFDYFLHCTSGHLIHMSSLPPQQLSTKELQELHNEEQHAHSVKHEQLFQALNTEDKINVTNERGHTNVGSLSSTSLANVEQAGSDGEVGGDNVVCADSKNLQACNRNASAGESAVSMSCCCGFLSTLSNTDIKELSPLRDIYDIQWNNNKNSNKSGLCFDNNCVLCSNSCIARIAAREHDDSERANQQQQARVFHAAEGILVENYFAKLNAIKLAFEGAMQLFHVDYCVFDR